MYERILVPLDGSTTAEIVLPYTEEIATKFGAEIILVNVSESAASEAGHLYRSYVEHIREQVEHQLQDWESKGEVKVQGVVLVGRPAPEILRYSDENDVGLIIMASRGRSSGGPWRLGNVAGKVLRAMGKPVLLIRAQAGSAAVQQRRLVKRILLPLDGSRTGEAAIPYVEALAQVLGAQIVLFNAVMPRVVVSGGADFLVGGAPVAVLPKEEDERLRASAMAYLNGVGKAIREKGLDTSSAVGLGPTADQIIDYAEANAIDLIAMSTHGRSGVGRWVFGSVTDKVLHAGDTPVLIVRATKA